MLMAAVSSGSKSFRPCFQAVLSEFFITLVGLTDAVLWRRAIARYEPQRPRLIAGKRQDTQNHAILHNVINRLVGRRGSAAGADA
jgi:hypothetical protein